MAASKIIHFIVGERSEKAEFMNDAKVEDLKECFRSAAEAGPYDILKLYNHKGNLINISTNLEANSPETKYKLEVVAAHCGHCGKDLHGVDVEEIEKRLQQLEKKVYIDHGDVPLEFSQLKDEVNAFKDKLEGVEHLSWLGLFKEITSGTSPIPVEKKGLRKSGEHYTGVLEKFLRMGHVEPSSETLNDLRQPTFDSWQWEDAEMLFLLQQMYSDLGLMQAFHIEMYGMICQSDIQKFMDREEILTMLTAAICHDLDHPGYNNTYQVNARTELAIRYNDISPLENHHASVAFDILSRPNCNILANLDAETYRKVRVGIIQSILATDMAQHSNILNEFKDILAKGFDHGNSGHKRMLMKIFIKVADVSNEARPMDVAEPWLECLLEESFNQSDVEKLEGLPVAPFMDRDKVTKPSAQIGFIKFVLIPLFDALRELFPALGKSLIDSVNDALDYYENMAKTTDVERKRREERKHSSGTPPRKLSTENTDLLNDSRVKGAGERKRSPVSTINVGNGPLEQNITSNTNSGCNVAERKVSKEHVSNSPMIVGK